MIISFFCQKVALYEKKTPIFKLYYRLLLFWLKQTQ